MSDRKFAGADTSIPAVVSVVKEINEPRTPTLKDKIRELIPQQPPWKSFCLSLLHLVPLAIFVLSCLAIASSFMRDIFH